MTIEEKVEELVSDFDLFEDWTDKYEYIISLGKELKGLELVDKTEENIVKGCQSKVWLVANLQEGKVRFKADSDAIISKGIIAMLIKILDNESPETIANYNFSFIDEIGLKEHLSPNRSNGLVGMMDKIKLFAHYYTQNK
jgi:cysteine desulfuration protein SufE